MLRIYSEANDSGAFVDSNIFESALKDLEIEKQIRESNIQQTNRESIKNKPNNHMLNDYNRKETS